MLDTDEMLFGEKGFDRVIKTTNAVGSSETVVYDEAGNVLKFTDYAGNVTTYTYDDFDRVIAKAVGGRTQ